MLVSGEQTNAAEILLHWTMQMGMENATPQNNMDKSEHVMFSEINQTHKVLTGWFHLYKIQEEAKPVHGDVSMKIEWFPYPRTRHRDPGLGIGYKEEFGLWRSSNFMYPYDLSHFSDSVSGELKFY